MKHPRHERIAYAARALVERLEMGLKHDDELRSLKRALAKPGTVAAEDPVVPSVTD
jgi:hypothetical protein